MLKYHKKVNEDAFPKSKSLKIRCSKRDFHVLVEHLVNII